MVYTSSAAEYQRNGGPTNNKIHEFFDICGTFEDEGKKERYEAYRLQARLLGHRRTSHKNYGRFDFHDLIKWCLRNITMDEIVDDEPPSDAIEVKSDSFVKFTVSIQMKRYN